MLILGSVGNFCSCLPGLPVRIESRPECIIAALARASAAAGLKTTNTRTAGCGSDLAAIFSRERCDGVLVMH